MNLGPDDTTPHPDDLWHQIKHGCRCLACPVRCLAKREGVDRLLVEGDGMRCDCNCHAESSDDS